MEEFIIILPLVLAYILDLALGDPRWLPHPIVLFGKLISFGEKKLNKNNALFYKGMILTLTLTIGVFCFFHFALKILTPYPIATLVFNTVFLFFAIANKSLITEGVAVFKELKKGVKQGRERLSWIVGRDTSELDEQQIKTAVFETMSENLSDGVIAPLCYFAILGVPGAMLYKMVNTLDSMIGYKNDRYIHFGRFAAKLDDVLNYIPARLTALFMLIVTFKIRKLPFIIQYGNKHASPNAGYPEAALAAILHCRFGGPNYYHGKLVDKPYIGHHKRKLHDNEYKKVSLINHLVTLFFVMVISLIYMGALLL